ncbi:Serine/threonine-protein kinase/endoribonuclease IRE1 [Nibea albiflora]|uniref:Serine/threonine-protein kinase/endoribonuclease IRE1 n=1 Tax=Nibea albiflora TaxID=240163 RepID=A0ACB7ER63_NIBAL|nr:Serine/threonine-protein kinase/endoribonuclease IRE1 [Nibea albiflora]
MVQNLASKGDGLCSKIQYFLDMEKAVLVEPSPEEVFKTFYSDMLQEHPQTHLTMAEALFSVTGPNSDKYQLGSIKWLKDNVNAYLAGVVSRLPNIPERSIPSAVRCLRAVLCTMEEMPNEQALAVIDKLQDQLSKKERHEDIWGAALQTLYVIIQKTKRMNGWGLNIVKELCKTLVPFVQDQHPLDFQVYTYAIFAKLLSVKHAARIITSLGVTSVPEDILTYADMKMDDKLKQLLKQLKNHFFSPALDESKKRKEKAENPNNESPKRLSVPVMETASNVKPFNLKSPESSVKDQWIPNSKRWGDKLRKLHSAVESEVTRIGDMIYIKKEEFRIAKGSDGTEVYLGLKKKRTELAIKIVPKSNHEALQEEGILRLPELYRARIVRLIDSEEDEQFFYLALELCEYTLEEYIKILHPVGRRKLVFQILDALKALHCQNSPILHGDLKPQNILIDVNGKAILADFGKSGRLLAGETKCRMSKEADIEMAGMLIYYIYSGGRHEGPHNSDHVKDVMAKDLIEKMIDAKPQNRPNVEECLNHPFFWSTERQLNYSKEVGNRKEVERCGKAPATLISSMNKCVQVGSFTQWNKKFPSELVKMLEDYRRGPYPDNMLGLLRFIRNAYQHHPVDVAKVDLVSMFPHLFECAYMLAKSQGWNSEPLLKQMLTTRDDSPASDAQMVTNSDESLKLSVQESQPSPLSPSPE